MDAPTLTPVRTVARVETRHRLGPDAQVDDKALVFAPNDPALTDPFLLLAEDWFSSPGFEWHPHRGVETVTTVLDGVLEHGDSLGNAGALEPGDVQWMTAGRGIIHRELAYRDEHAHTLQLWLNLPAARKLTETRYQDLLAAHRPRVARTGAVVDVVSGTVDGVTGPALNHVDVQGALVRLDPGVTLRYPLPARHRAFVYVVAGRATVAGRRVAAGQTAWSDPVAGVDGGSELPLAAPDGDAPTRLMVYSGTPLREPVVFGGPFVMNRRSEITQAFADFRAGRFGDVPRQARLAYDR
ncbi:pirin family protein [Micromonospora okii]|uniref:pirin family protein n=1 Tax=Micromonospora okii TaxID=1182970 RepID=UPI001E5D34DD|nr:pirin family protein [Micromonospora okii]